MIRALVYKETDWYVAQCLEHDICVQARDLNRLGTLILHQMDFSGADLQKVPTAPEEFHAAWHDVQNEEIIQRMVILDRMIFVN